MIVNEGIYRKNQTHLLLSMSLEWTIFQEFKIVSRRNKARCCRACGRVGRDHGGTALQDPLHQRPQLRPAGPIFTELRTRRANTLFQLMTILEENHHIFLIVEHDPMLYEDAGEMVEYLAQALKQTSREATILLYAPALDLHLQKMTELADRVFASTKGRFPSEVMQSLTPSASGWPS